MNFSQIYEQYKLEINKIQNLITNRNVILIIGNTSSGKSTLCNWVLGEELVIVNQFNIDCKNTNAHFKIGHGNTSETSFVNCIEWEEKKILIDCPGFGDTRNSGISLMNNFMLQTICKKASSVRVVLVVAADELITNRGLIFKNTTNNLLALFPYLSILDFTLLITRVMMNQTEFPILDELKWSKAQIGYMSFALIKETEKKNIRDLLLVPGNSGRNIKIVKEFLTDEEQKSIKQYLNQSLQPICRDVKSKIMQQTICPRVQLNLIKNEFYKMVETQELANRDTKNSSIQLIVSSAPTFYMTWKTNDFRAFVKSEEEIFYADRKQVVAILDTLEAQQRAEIQRQQHLAALQRAETERIRIAQEQVRAREAQIRLEEEKRRLVKEKELTRQIQLVKDQQVRDQNAIQSPHKNATEKLIIASTSIDWSMVRFS